MRKVRCAIYTRKSSQEGLDQDFNSLDAQREACQAFIKSQQAEGWVLLPNRYDDGGISGGTLERPSLIQLLSDVDDGLVDQIVVYKIDRLTRSLSDFAKLVDQLDRAKASFVSVTQSFNTATSMGRLTLNVLLSFAQFEREVTAERIRDKIAASKQKGLWMGGNFPLGYEADGRTLKINAEDAKVIKTIFDLYLEYRTVGLVKEHADRLGLRTKRRTSKRSGTVSGGKLICRGNIHAILCNPVYIGKIRHKSKVYEGQHDAIIERDVFDQVQELLQQQSGKVRGRTRRAQSSPLIKKLFDETGDRLTPSHANKKGVRHRYYVSHRLIAKRVKTNQSKQRDGWRLPAQPLEKAISKLVAKHLSDPEFTSAIIAGLDPIVIKQRMEQLSQFTAHMKIRKVASIITTITIKPGRITILLDQSQLEQRLGVAAGCMEPKTLPVKISAPFQLRKRAMETKLIIGNLAPEPERDEVLIRNIAKAHDWYQKIKQGQSFTQIADGESTSVAMIKQKINLAFLAPNIVKQILNGKQPIGLTTRFLLSRSLPPSWQQQRQLLQTLQ